MLSKNKVQGRFWAEAINTACYSQNRSLLNKAHGKTPYEIWKGRKPRVSFFRIFGCRCFIHNNGKDQLKPFDAKADEGIFLGYSAHSKAFQVFNCRTLVVEESPHVKFDESSSELRKQQRLDEEVADKLKELNLKQKGDKEHEYIDVLIPNHYNFYDLSDLEEAKGSTAGDPTSADLNFRNEVPTIDEADSISAEIGSKSPDLRQNLTIDEADSILAEICTKSPDLGGTPSVPADDDQWVLDTAKRCRNQLTNPIQVSLPTNSDEEEQVEKVPPQGHKWLKDRSNDLIIGDLTAGVKTRRDISEHVMFCCCLRI
ncbi:hypothetical protein ACS0TY_030482 [Phlomoides rotata]